MLRTFTSSVARRATAATGGSARCMSGKAWIPNVSMDTEVVHGGVNPDEKTGAILTPVYLSTTFVQ